MRVHEIDLSACGAFDPDRFSIFVCRIDPQAGPFDEPDVVDILQGLDVFDQRVRKFIDADRAECPVVYRQRSSFKFSLPTQFIPSRKSFELYFHNTTRATVFANNCLWHRNILIK